MPPRAATFRGAFNYARMLLAEGRVDEAPRWLARSGETATRGVPSPRPPDWLADHGHANLAGDAAMMIVDSPGARRRGVARAARGDRRGRMGRRQRHLGPQSALAKDNEQLPEAVPCRARLGRIVLDALGPARRCSSPPRCRSRCSRRCSTATRAGRTSARTVDNAVRIQRGSDFRIRSDLSATLFLADPDSLRGRRAA
jgi:hypothetical protein